MNTWHKDTNVSEWHNLCITDKTGVERFKCTASPMSTVSEIRNLKQHLAAARKQPSYYKFLDVDTAVIMLDGELYSEQESILSDEDIDNMLKELGM